ncbi:MAG TPA: ZIP family metal transporter [Gaiellaceae bacterium]|nr:ZIP family metal transporter [Gaiellaceae bacterium]
MALLLGAAAVLATTLGGLFALKRADRLHLILGFSAGAVLGVALFDLLPESFDLGRSSYASTTIALFIGIGFFAYTLLNNVILLHPESEDDAFTPSSRRGALGAASLSLHSFLDGVGIGLAFKVSTTVGAVVAAAVLAHDFSDGINTVSVVLRNRGRDIRALRWLAVDAIAPLLGVASTYLYSLSQARLGLVLAIFCGCFLYIGASDLLPESHHRHPKRLTIALNICGAALIWLTIHLASI